MTPIAVTCPAERRVFSRRKLQAKWRRSARWKKMLAFHAHIPEARCAICGRKHLQLYTKRDGKTTLIRLTINHTDRTCYFDEEAYLTWDPARMRVECTTCNWMYEKGMIPCPECLKEGIVTYIRWDEGECFGCWMKKHPDEYQKMVAGREQFKAEIKEHNAQRAAKRRADRHSCRRHKKGQVCGRSACRCTFSSKKAPACKYYLAKAGAMA